VEGRPLSADGRVLCLGVISPAVAPALCVDLGSSPLPRCREDQGFSSSGRLTPLSFQGFRSALKLLVDSMEMRDVFDTLLEPLKNGFDVEWELFLRRSKNEEIDDMLPGLRSRSKMVLRSRAASSAKADEVGESVAIVVGGCRSFDSKKGRESSNESDFGRGMAPFTTVTSTEAAAS